MSSPTHVEKQLPSEGPIVIGREHVRPFDIDRGSLGD